MADSLRLQTLALMGQQFLIQALSNGGSLDSAMQEMLTRPTAMKTGNEKTAAALTGRIRSDAGVLRQGSKNAQEGATMASMIKSSAESIGNSLTEMQNVIESYQANQISIAEAQSAFTSLAKNISATVSGTKYNGISLMDKAGWAIDERLSVNGATASVSIQMGNAATSFSLHDLSYLGGLETKNLVSEAADGFASLKGDLSTYLGTVNIITAGYGALESSYTSQAKAMENQSEVLSKTAARTISEASLHPADIASRNPEALMKAFLYDYLLRDSGRLVNTSS